jgi:hypothetical protein
MQNLVLIEKQMGQMMVFAKKSMRKMTHREDGTKVTLKQEMSWKKKMMQKLSGILNDEMTEIFQEELMSLSVQRPTRVHGAMNVSKSETLQMNQKK